MFARHVANIYNLADIHYSNTGRGREVPFNGTFRCYYFPLSALRLNPPTVGDVDDLKKCAPEDLLIANLCIAISDLSLDDPLLLYEDLKLLIPSIDVDFFMLLPASEEAEKPPTSMKSWMGLALDSFVRTPGRRHGLSWRSH